MKIDINGLKADARKYLDCLSQKYVDEAAEKFYEAARQTILDVFYGAYPPFYYHRTDDLGANSYYKYKHNNGSRRYGGVVISDRDMSDYQNSWQNLQSVTPASEVVQWSWTKGYHGYLGGNPANAIYTYPPISALEMRIGEIVPQLEQVATNYARSQSYQYLRF